MRKYKGIIALFILGLAIVLYPHGAQIVNNYLQHNEVNEFQQYVQSLSDDEIDDIMERAKHCNEEIYYDADGFRDPWGDDQEKLTAFNECLGVVEQAHDQTNSASADSGENFSQLNFSDDEIFSAIEIPKLKLVIPIYLGSSEDVLSKGVGQVEGSSLPLGGDSTHTVLAGHRGMGTKAMFRNIDQLHDGDVFYIHTMSETLTYEVYRQKVIYPDETDDLEIIENKDLATLLTCHPYRHNYQRLLIQAERKN